MYSTSSDKLFTDYPVKINAMHQMGIIFTGKLGKKQDQIRCMRKDRFQKSVFLCSHQPDGIISIDSNKNSHLL